MKNHQPESASPPPTIAPHAFRMLALLPPKALHFYMLVLVPLVDSFPEGIEITYQALANKLNVFSATKTLSRFEVRNLLNRIQSVGLIEIQKTGRSLSIVFNKKLQEHFPATENENAISSTTSNTSSSTLKNTSPQTHFNVSFSTEPKTEKRPENSSKNAAVEGGASTHFGGDQNKKKSTTVSTKFSTEIRKNHFVNDYMNNNYINNIKYYSTCTSPVPTPKPLPAQENSEISKIESKSVLSSEENSLITEFDWQNVLRIKGFSEMVLKKPNVLFLIRSWITLQVTAEDFEMAANYAEAKLGKHPDHPAYYRNFVHEVLKAKAAQTAWDGVTSSSDESAEHVANTEKTKETETLPNDVDEKTPSNVVVLFRSEKYAKNKGNEKIENKKNEKRDEREKSRKKPSPFSVAHDAFLAVCGVGFQQALQAAEASAFALAERETNDRHSDDGSLGRPECGVG